MWWVKPGSHELYANINAIKLSKLLALAFAFTLEFFTC